MSETRKPTDEQPAPVPERADLPAVWDLVLRDMDLLAVAPPPCFKPDPKALYGALLGIVHAMALLAGSPDVRADMRERDAIGRARYRTPLQPHNGRNALADGYQEALDLLVYFRQHLYEQEGA